VKDDARSPIQHALILHRIDPEQRVARFYSLMIERNLFGRIGTRGRERVEEYPSEQEAALALEALAKAKRWRGYGDL
jgi:predicted DNA-binding WGR domain protein